MEDPIFKFFFNFWRLCCEKILIRTENRIDERVAQVREHAASGVPRQLLRGRARSVDAEADTCTGGQIHPRTTGFDESVRENPGHDAAGRCKGGTLP